MSALRPLWLTRRSVDVYHGQIGTAQNLALVAVHNHALKPYMPLLQQTLETDFARAHESPCEHASVLVGDLNHIFPDELSVEISSAQLSSQL